MNWNAVMDIFALVVNINMIQTWNMYHPALSISELFVVMYQIEYEDYCYNPDPVS